MRNETIYISDISESDILSHARVKRARYDHYIGVTDAYVKTALCRAIGYNLRYNRKANVMRDSSGWLSKPSVPSEWSEATPSEAREYLCQEIWCNAVRNYNRHNM